MSKEEEIKLMFETVFLLEGIVKTKVHWQEGTPFYVVHMPPVNHGHHVMDLIQEFKFFKLGLEIGMKSGKKANDYNYTSKENL